MFAAEGKDGVLSLSLNHGFPWADVRHAGAKMLAVADRDIEIARRAARRLAAASGGARGSDAAVHAVR